MFTDRFGRDAAEALHGVSVDDQGDTVVVALGQELRDVFRPSGGLDGLVSWRGISALRRVPRGPASHATEANREQGSHRTVSFLPGFEQPLPFRSFEHRTRQLCPESWQVVPMPEVHQLVSHHVLHGSPWCLAQSPVHPHDAVTTAGSPSAPGIRESVALGLDAEVSCMASAKSMHVTFSAGSDRR